MITDKKGLIAVLVSALLAISFISCHRGRQHTSGTHKHSTDTVTAWPNSSLITYNAGKKPTLSAYPYLAGGRFSGPNIAQSPDPLVRYRWDHTKADDNLQVYYLRPISVTTETPGSFDNLASLTTSAPHVTVRGAGSIMLDFGVESAAWLEFDSPDLSGSVTASISEYNEPGIVNTGAQNRLKTQKPIKYGNTYRLELNDLLYEGVRFGWIHIDDFDKPWHIDGIRLLCQVKPTNYTGSFSSSDPMLTRIWYTAAYSVKLNLLQDYFGAILMERSDRHSWTGDAYTSQAASLVAFGNFDFVKHNIARTANVSNAIESYSLYWIFSLLDYYRYTGDRDTLEGYIPNIEGKLRHGLAIYGKNSHLRFFGWDERLGAGFENSDCPESQNAYKMLFINACRQFAWAIGQCGRKNLRDAYNKIADEKIEELRKRRQWYTAFGIHACADAVNAGFTNDKEHAEMFRREFADPVQRVSFSPFNQYFIIQALAGMNRFDEAQTCIRRCWGGQIELGATTFWEVFRPEWSQFLNKNDAVPNGQHGYTSLCHPWASGVAKWLTEQILGIKPVTAGFDSYEIIPHLGKTLTWVKGNVLTPYGQIKASFDVCKGVCTIHSPAGTVGRFCIPRAEKRINEICINGKLAWDGTYRPVEGIGDAQEDADFVYFNSVRPGTYSVKVSYSGTTPAFVERPISYSARVLAEDTQTSGNWGRVYGSRGYVLFNYNGPGQDIRRLPEYVKFVDFKQAGGEADEVSDISAVGTPRHLVWSASTTDDRAAAADARNGPMRKAAALSTRNPLPCYQTMAIDIGISTNRNYQVALYFVDWDKQKRRLAVEMFDYETKNLVAPVRMVSDFEGGKYLVYTYNKSVRFRISQIRGGDAVLSGIFFDNISDGG